MSALISPFAASGSGPFSAPYTDSTSAADSSDSSSSSTDNSATITSNDFLQLLVTEMQNQDPTANTDPNEYISQLVQVNSLEQLVQINQTLGGTSTSATGDSDSFQAASAGATSPGAATQNSGTNSATDPAQTGNLVLPTPSSAPYQVSHALTTSPAESSNSIRPLRPQAGTVHTPTFNTAR